MHSGISHFHMDGPIQSAHSEAHAFVVEHTCHYWFLVPSQVWYEETQGKEGGPKATTHKQYVDKSGKRRWAGTRDLVKTGRLN